jgi:CheY-like chemotaxis protein
MTGRPSTRAPLTLLVVEDDLLLGAALARALGRLFARVVCVASQAAAMAELTRAQPGGAPFDVVISDFDLSPGGNGAELLRDVRARWPAVRRVLYTASAVVLDDGTADAVVDKGRPFAALVDAIIAKS